MASGKENVLPITPLAMQMHGLMTASPMKASFASRLNAVSGSPQKAPIKKEEVDDKLPSTAAQIVSPHKRALGMISPNKRPLGVTSPSTKKSPQQSPKARTGLKHKRNKKLQQEVESVKDVAKLQEEVNENREKISSLQARLTAVQKDKDSISTQLAIVEEIKLHLNQQLEEKNKQLDEVKADSEILNQQLGSTQKTLEQSLSDLAKEKVSKADHSVKRARTEVVSELKTINYTQEREELTRQLEQLKEENTKALLNLEEIATKEREKTKEQEKTISILQQNCEETSKKYTALKQDFFISTCLAVKLNLSRLGRPVNIQVDELWEVAQAQDVPIEQFPTFITNEIRKRYDAVAVNKKK